MTRHGVDSILELLVNSGIDYLKKMELEFGIEVSYKTFNSQIN